MLKIIFVLSFFSMADCARNWEPNCVGDGFNGVCVEPHNCFSTNPYISGLVYPQPCTTYYGYRGVCCTDCELVHNASNAILDKTTKTGLLWKSGEKSWDKCLEYVQKYNYRSCGLYSYMKRKPSEEQCHVYTSAVISTYAVGGKDAARGEYPHMALLGYNGTRDSSEWLCSAALISERFLLTAAHCLYSRDLGPVTEVALGILKRSDPSDQWHRYKIKRVIPHPEYRGPSKYHDIAILETEEQIQFINKTVLPACLPAHDDAISYDGERFTVTATGWGGLGYLRELADTMQKVSLTKFSDEECEAMYPTTRTLTKGLDHNGQMCYGHKTDVRDTCKGDSGGPLQTDNNHPTCMHTLIGVTSYGRECGFQGQGGVYTRVAKYLPWIEGVVWP